MSVIDVVTISSPGSGSMRGDGDVHGRGAGGAGDDVVDAEHVGEARLEALDVNCPWCW